MAKLFSAPNLPPVQSTAAQSILQGAQAQAQMYSSLGQALGKVANTYFEKKAEDAQLESLAQDERVLNAIYGGRKDASGMPVMPTDFKEVKKDVKALFKGLGGREGVEMHLGRMKSEQRAQEIADRLDRTEKKLIQQEKDSDSYIDAMLKPGEVKGRRLYSGLEGFKGLEGKRLGEVFPKQLTSPQSILDKAYEGEQEKGAEELTPAEKSSIIEMVEEAKQAGHPTDHPNKASKQVYFKIKEEPRFRKKIHSIERFMNMPGARDLLSTQPHGLDAQGMELVQTLQQGGLPPEDIITEFEKAGNPDVVAQAPAVRAYLFPAAITPAAGAPQLDAQDIEFIDNLQSRVGLSAEEIAGVYYDADDERAPAVRAYLGLPPAAGAQAPQVAQPEPSYASRLMGGLQRVGETAREKLAEVRIPEELPTQEVTLPGQSLLARSSGMTGPAFTEAFMLQNPDATPGMKRQLVKMAGAMRQKVPERPEFVREGTTGYLYDPVTGKHSAPFQIPEAGKVGRDAMDTAFAKEMIDYKPTDVRKNLVQLQEAIDTLEGVATQRDVDRDDDLKVGEKIDPPDSISGWFVGFIPEAFRDVTHPRSAEVREAIQEVVQRNLRPILGSAFGEKEGEQVLARAFNPKLDEVENLKRVKRLFTQMEDAHREYMKKRAYFEENLTLKGYKGQSLEELWDGFGLRLPAGAERQLEHRTAQQIVDEAIQRSGGDVERVRVQINDLETSDDPSMTEDSRLEAARMLREKFKI